MKMARLLLLLLVGIQCFSCRSHIGFRQQYVTALRPQITQGDWAMVAQSIEDSKNDIYREEDRVMFWLNKGIALHYAGEYERSSELFFKAEEAIEDLFTKSISEEVGRFVATETVQTYNGEDYERILTYLYTAINAYQLGRSQDALVEVRRADQFLRKMRVKFESKDGLGTVYTQDAFILWLIGLFLDLEGGTPQDAYTAYKDAWKAYSEVYKPKFDTSGPTYLLVDLARLARRLGLDKEAHEWAQKLEPNLRKSLEEETKNYAEVILIHGNGEAPYKKQKSFQAVLPDGYALKLAIPELLPSPGRIKSSRLIVSKKQTLSEAAEPVTSIAVRNFKEREGKIKARAIARAAIKYGATKAVSEAVKGNKKDKNRVAIGLGLNILGGLVARAVEKADLRSWTLLPSEFRVARVQVEPGTHDLEIELIDAAGFTVRSVSPKQVTLKAGERYILSVRSID